ncbi:5'-phosphate synthase pdxT subunit [Desulfitispora alkaliphila]|uniref:pyridoxal 5'-phosphate synthase glutaminase subunit PdxT n=1 Tax=Desulfitispora alkaliphila TaxID=622674 RepID=UPI003D1B7A61
MKIGILALQGAFREHIKSLEQCGCETIEIRTVNDLNEIDGLVIPGGESTTIGKLLCDFKMMDDIKTKVENGMPIFGTCAGLIILAKDIHESEQPRLGLMDISAKSNAFGRQVDSFEVDINIDVLGEKSFPAVFIRAPYIEKVEPNVGILAEYRDKIVMARQGNVLACAFHPELTDDLRVHQYFLQIVAESKEIMQ